MATARIWIQTSRPKTLFASISPVLLGSAIAYAGGYYNLPLFLATLLTAIFIQIGTNFSNDYFDHKKGSDTERRIGPQRALQKGLISKDQLRYAIYITFLLAAITSSFLVYQGGLLILFLFTLAILFAIGYTAGPFALAYTGLSDIVVFIFFGPIATGMTAYLQTERFELIPFLIGIVPGALSTAILVMNNLRDYPEDSRHNKRTLVVRFGIQAGKQEFLLLLLFAFTTHALIAVTLKPLLLIALLPLIPALRLLRDLARAHAPPDYIPLFPRTAALLPLYTLLTICAWIF